MKILVIFASWAFYEFLCKLIGLATGITVALVTNLNEGTSLAFIGTIAMLISGFLFFIAFSVVFFVATSYGPFRHDTQ